MQNNKFYSLIINMWLKDCSVSANVNNTLSYIMENMIFLAILKEQFTQNIFKTEKLIKTQ